MVLIEAESGIGWDGEVLFGAIDEKTLRNMDLLDEQAFLRALKSGNLLWKRRVLAKNKVTNYARAAIAQILSGAMSPPVLPSRAELGTGIGTPAGTDTDLWSPAVATLKSIAYAQQYLSYYAQYVTTWLTSDPIQGTWTEIGLKDAGGNLWAHAAITSNLTVNSGEMLVAQWPVQILGN